MVDRFSGHEDRKGQRGDAERNAPVPDYARSYFSRQKAVNCDWECREGRFGGNLGEKCIEICLLALLRSKVS